MMDKVLLPCFLAIRRSQSYDHNCKTGVCGFKWNLIFLLLIVKITLIACMFILQDLPLAWKQKGNLGVSNDITILNEPIQTKFIDVC